MLGTTTLGLNFNNFTSKDVVSLKAQHFLSSVFSTKSIQDMEVKFNMVTRLKVVIGCLQLMLKIFFYLSLLMRLACLTSAIYYYLQISPYDSIISY